MSAFIRQLGGSMKFLKQPKRTKQKKILNKKEVNPKVARIVFLSALGVMIMTIPLSFLLAKTANVRTKEMEQTIGQLQQQLSVVNENKVNQPLAQRYLDDFVSVYMNKPTDDNGINQRTKELTSYFVAKLPAEDETKVRQDLLSSSFFAFETVGKETIARYVVHYKVSYPVEKKRSVTHKKGDKSVTEQETYQETEQKETTVLLNIPFMQKGEQFKVTSLPYYSPVPSLQAGAMEGKTTNHLSLDKVEEQEEGKVVEFLKQFYQMYCSDDQKQMSYMMDHAEVLGSDYTLASTNPTIYKDKQKLIIVDTPVFQEGKSGNNHKEYLVLTVVRKDGKFYIEKLSHDLGGLTK